MSKLAFRAVILGAVIAVLGIASYAIAGGSKHHLKGVTMEGAQENPNVSTGAEGTFEAEIAKDDSSISYTLSYSGLEGTVSQGHIHFGKAFINGGISLWLCKATSVPGAPLPAHDPPTCPGPNAGVVSGVLHPDDVVGPAGQGIETTAWGEILEQIRSGQAYANVHSSKFPGGEIRAQIEDHGKLGPG